MAIKPSAALEALRSELVDKMPPRDEKSPITWGDVIGCVEDALRDVENAEHDDYMGEDQ